MAETGHRETAKEVEVAIAVGVEEVSAMTAYEGDRRTTIGICKVGVGKSHDFGIVHRNSSS